jgi:hypothetical protein
MVVNIVNSSSVLILGIGTAESFVLLNPQDRQMPER